MKRGFLFDFDGVVCDSEKYHYLAWRETAASLGVPFSQEEYLPFQSTGRRAVIAELCRKKGIECTEDVFQTLSAEKTAAFARAIERVDKKDLVAGVVRFLDRLVRENALLAVASGARTAKEMLRTLGLTHYFFALVDGTDGLPPKPDPAVFLCACERLGLTPEDCVVFEDSPAGVRAAKAGGFSVVGIGSSLPHADFPVYADFNAAYAAFFPV